MGIDKATHDRRNNVDSYQINLKDFRDAAR